MKPTLEKRLEKALREAIELADIGGRRPPAHKIAERVYEAEPDLVEEAEPDLVEESKRPMILDRWTWMITRMRRDIWSEQRPSAQMILIDDPNFRHLPKAVFLRNGKRPKLERLALKESEEHLKLLRERFKVHPRVSQWEAIVELHRKWAIVKRGATLGEAMRLEAEEREKS